MPRLRGSFRGRGAARRRTAWFEGPGSSSPSASISADQVLLLGLGLSINSDGLTLVRTRGIFEASLLTSNAAGGGYMGALGIGLINKDAFAVGVTTVLDPITDSDWDGWLYHRWFSVHTVSATIADGVNAQGAYERFEVDSKAMRKLKEEDVMFAVVQVVEDSTATMEIRFDSRILVKLP